MISRKGMAIGMGVLSVVGVWSVAIPGASYGATPAMGHGSHLSSALREAEPRILIVGARGDGSESHMVFIDGITEGLVGQQVVPYFRFPGQSGFTAGLGTRTVDANGDFAWQRKAGKQIVIEFRSGEVRSNEVTIRARQE